MSARARSLMALVSPLSRARPLLRTVRLFSATALLALTSPSPNIGGVHRGVGGLDPDVHNIKYDGRFTFARIRYVTGPGGYYYRGLPAWAHGYNMAESNLMKIMREVTALRPHVDEGNAIALDDPELLKYPIAYMTEAGFWTMTDREAAGMRAYLLKGGFIIFDDFRDDFRSAGWANFETNMRRSLPDVRFVDLDPSHPIFHSFFDIDSFDQLPQYYDRGRPIFRGAFQDNDPKKRLMVMINFNTDVSNYWEFSATGWVPVEESNQGYKLGVNYLMYALTH
ncbi:MAG: hypothetical protein DMD26_07730 [Gemmatimonadetes bacterium]|nr:MAG: hypothetical protein DMD26_07730 [Gemmatimonadota bacterium]